MEHNVVKTTESGSMLVLFADGLLEDIDLDMACLVRQPGGRKKSLKACIQVLKQPNGECRRRAKARPPRNISDRGHFYPSIRHQFLENGAQDWMLDPVHRVHKLGLGIFNVYGRRVKI